jgi:hypothetical protein
MKSKRLITYISLLIVLAIGAGCSPPGQQSTDSTVTNTIASTKTPTSRPDTSKVATAEQVDIDELVELATGNIMAADQYKGKLVTADGIVASVDEDNIIVAGLIAGREAAEWGYLEMESDGFTCVYAKADQGKAVQLRPEDSITVTGTITGWETVFGTNARLQDCQFKSPQHP